ncbi:unnamed protein product [Cochlearia groenlandica]
MERGRQHKFNKLTERKVHPTRFLDTNVLIKQGIREQVEDLLDRMNMKTLITLDEPTYPELTRQFLGTMKYEDQGSSGNVNFKQEDKFYSIPFAKLCEQYGLDQRKRMQDTPTFHQGQFLWSNIAVHEEFHHSRARLSKVRKPMIRYVLRLLGIHTPPKIWNWVSFTVNSSIG